ncbi:hypothetical protein L210DRAFT_2077756 [Boletus edulis BED1]|uniref:Uncharacterized protein n=1 Tax=Boletus edulis BED1 TaxID=1328754 RepID=A0AAD4BVV6_BOLED|nr:hypothetical protein L210DRAFT_2077756 [Boletus edulis BED1]
MRRCQASPDDNASAVSRYTNASTNAAHTRANTIDVSECRPPKRRKVAGLNRRFDRMIKSVNTLLSYRTSSPASSRKRMQSSGTSSVSSHDVPKTPVDAYSDLHQGQLGKDSSVMKKKKSRVLPLDDSDGFTRPAAPPKEPRSPLPDWLADTFYRLEPDHPLRGLLSPSRINTETKSHLPAVALPGASREEEIFAFSPFQKQEETPDAAYRDNGTSNMQGHVPSTVSISPTLSHLQLEVSTNPLPFSTPGRFAPLRRSRSIVDRAVQKTVIPVSQQVSSQTTNIMHPPASRLRSDDVIGRPQFTQAFSNLVQDIEPPSDLQEPGANLNHHQVFQADCDNLNVYVTPGPTFACSRPVYFDPRPKILRYLILSNPNCTSWISMLSTFAGTRSCDRMLQKAR